MKGLKLFICILILIPVTLYGQGSGTPSTLRVLVDANGYLVVSVNSQTLPLSQPTVFSNTRLKTDASGYLQVVVSGGGLAPANATYITQTPDAVLTNEQALSLLSTGLMYVTTGTGVVSSTLTPSVTGILLGNGSAASPSLAFTNDASNDSGMYLIGANNIGFSSGGTLRWDYNNSRILSTTPIIAAVGSAITPGFQLDSAGDDGFYNGDGYSIAFGIGGSNKGGIASSGAMTVTALISQNYVGFGAGTTLRSPSDGVTTLLNSAETSYGRLQFGGTTSSFPALKRSSTTIQFRLADDSADAPISFSTGTASVNVNSPFHSSSATSILTISSNVIAPTGSVHHLGAGLVKTITVPSGCTPTCSIDIVPDAAFTTDATGNISLASTAVINKTLRFTWDGTKWNPSY